MGKQSKIKQARKMEEALSPLELAERREKQAFQAKEDDARNLVKKQLKGDKTPESISEAAKLSSKLVDHVVTQVTTTMAKRGTHVACKLGCAFCCSLRVTASVPEIVRLATFMRATFSAEDLAAARARIDAHVAQTKTMSPVDRSRPLRPCALLVNGICSVYEARPNSCRAHHSLDVSRCEADIAVPGKRVPVPRFTQIRAESDAIIRGTATALTSTGLGHPFVELIQGLQIALEKPEAAAAWLEGEPVFMAAVDPEAESAALADVQELKSQVENKSR